MKCSLKTQAITGKKAGKALNELKSFCNRVDSYNKTVKALDTKIWDDLKSQFGNKGLCATFKFVILNNKKSS